MIEFFYAPTPNGWKVAIALEGLPYRVTPVFFNRGDQFKPEFLKISPNNRMPAIIDHDAGDGQAPLSVFESGAILIYLAEKSKRFLPEDRAGRFQTIQWLMWQMGGLGPMAGQHGHFFLYAPEKIPYAIDRYRAETMRLYKVLDAQLEKTGRYLAGDTYTIADMACFPWIMTHKAQTIPIEDFPNVKRWFTELRARPAVIRGTSLEKETFANRTDFASEEDRRAFFGISRKSSCARAHDAARPLSPNDGEVLA
jgi:GSH-dependent disulfide-bond oxidoreductase